ncbi:glycosyltransferase family 4 protein [Natronoarchaeum sp. GCM10025703]|uniref:glycosyltransferase family 4 protein n=1 Tax=unclassified Natronoarchaeum TaxID=2620183 RepID=UPI0036175C5F
MKINVLLPHFGLSGGIRSVVEITNRLVDRGHNVTIITSHIAPTMPHSIMGSLRTVCASGLGTVSRVSQTLDWLPVKADKQKILHMEPRFDRMLERWIPEADCTIATAWETAYPVATLSESKGQKFYFVQHYEIWPVWDDSDCWEEASALDGRPSVNMTKVTPDDPHLQSYKKLVDESYELSLDLIITSEWEEDVLDELGHEHCGKVKYGIDFDTFYPDLNVDDDDDPTILALYRNSREKGDEQAIESFKRLHEERPDVNYLMFGTKERPVIPDFVEFHEDPSQENIRRLYSQADIFVYPSWVEGYGMPPMEAMACKTAVVSTDVGAVREYSPEKSVKFIPARQTVPIVTAVKNLLDNPERVERMKGQCHEYIQQFTWDNATDQFENILIDR